MLSYALFINNVACSFATIVSSFCPHCLRVYLNYSLDRFMLQQSSPDEGLPASLQTIQSVRVAASTSFTTSMNPEPLHWILTLDPYTGSSRWILTLDPHAGSSRWILTLDPHAGSSRWILTLDPHAGSARWILTLDPHAGSSRWILTLDPHAGSLQLTIFMRSLQHDVSSCLSNIHCFTNES